MRKRHAAVVTTLHFIVVMPYRGTSCTLRNLCEGGINLSRGRPSQDRIFRRPLTETRHLLARPMRPAIAKPREDFTQSLSLQLVHNLTAVYHHLTHKECDSNDLYSDEESNYHNKKKEK